MSTFMGPSQAGNIDAFLVKLDPGQSGSGSLLYGTYLGGSNYDDSLGIDLDGEGRVYLTGFTQSTDFPRTAGCFQPMYAEHADGTPGLRDKLLGVELPPVDKPNASPEARIGVEMRNALAMGRFIYANAFASVVAISAGVGATAIPAALSAAILSAAAPLPPEMIAPA